MLPASGGTEIVRWYTREDHEDFDVCADDHCQRYHGVTKIISAAATEAVDATRGVFLVYDEEVCDARFYKACGGLTEDFASAWEDRAIPYLRSVSDGREAIQTYHIRRGDEGMVGSTLRLRSATRTTLRSCGRSFRRSIRKQRISSAGPCDMPVRNWRLSLPGDPDSNSGAFVHSNLCAVVPRDD